MSKFAPAPHDSMVSAILRVYGAATRVERHNGAEWYNDAHSIALEMAAEHSVSVDLAACIISVLSPSNLWDRNVADADRMLAAWRAGDKEAPKCSTYGANTRKAWAILQGERDLADAFSRRARKTENFAALIANPRGRAVVVDGHAYCIAAGHRTPLADVPSFGIGAYNAIAEAYRAAADTVGIAPHAMQAITWLAWRAAYLSKDQQQNENPFPWEV